MFLSSVDFFLDQVLLNLANQYANNEMYPEALNSYQVIVKNKMFSNAGESIRSNNKNTND